MIRKDELVKGIKINNKKFKLSPYADNTQIFLDGSDLSLKRTLVILNKFFQVSGLNVIDKTKALWIGSMSKPEKKKYAKNFVLIGNKNL